MKILIYVDSCGHKRALNIELNDGQSALNILSNDKESLIDLIDCVYDYFDDSDNEDNDEVTNSLLAELIKTNELNVKSIQILDKISIKLLWDTVEKFSRYQNHQIVEVECS